MTPCINIPMFFVFLIFLSSCSLFPYQEHFACEASQDHGRCVDVNGAYDMATGAGERGYPMTTDSKPPAKPAVSDEFAVEPPVAPNHPEITEKSHDTHYANYRQSVYRKLQQLLEQPKTPLVRPAEVVRTLILNYQARLGQGQPLFMPRYVYFFGSHPGWVLGASQAPPADPSLLNITTEPAK